MQQHFVIVKYCLLIDTETSFKDLYNIMISVTEQPTFLSTQLVISIT